MLFNLDYLRNASGRIDLDKALKKEIIKFDGPFKIDYHPKKWCKYVADETRPEILFKETKESKCR